MAVVGCDRVLLAKVEGMTKRFTETDLSKFQANSARRNQAPAPATTRLMPKPRKYKNVPVVVDGHRFDSQLEAKRYEELKLLKRADRIQYFLRRVRFDLFEGAQYECDFYVVWGSPVRGIEKITVEDTKGVETEAFTLKRKALKSLYGIDVVLIRAADR